MTDQLQQELDELRPLLAEALKDANEWHKAASDCEGMGQWRAGELGKIESCTTCNGLGRI